MSKKLYEETNIQDIASAIREKNGSQNTYTVSQMGNAVRAIHTDPVLEDLSVTENGNYLPSAGKDGFSSVAVNVSGGYPEPTGTIQVTQNGEVNVKDYATANVNVPGGGSDLYPLWTDIYDNPMPTGVSVTTPSITVPGIAPAWLESASQNVQNFANNECRFTTRNSANGFVRVQITKDIAQMSLNQLLNDSSFGELVEYYGNLYNTQLLTEYNMVLLGDFSQGGSATGNTLADAITNYSAIALQGIYSKSRTSQYNTTIIYPLELDVARWTGMKDRNSSYDCNVTFTDANTVSLSGNKQVIIYGIP